MALQEKEFIVKNGLDIKNNVVKLGGTAGANNQVPAKHGSNGTTVWKNITAGGGISVAHNDTDIIISTLAVLPGDVAVSQNLTTTTGYISAATSLSAGTTLTVGSTAQIGTSLTITGVPSIIAATVSNTASVFNTTTSNILFGTASPTISIGNAASTTTFGGIVTHKGITLQPGVAGSQKVDTSYTFTTASIALGTTWINSGISGASQLMSGIYLMSIKDGTNIEYYLGVLPWHSGNGYSSLLDSYTEVPLTKYGDGGTGHSIFARIFRTANSAPVIQLACTSSLPSAAFTITFRKLLD